LKSDFWSGRARLNVALFSSDYKNFQAEVQRGVSFSIQNVADATIKGLEVEAVVKPDESLQLQVAYTYLNTEVSSGVINGVNIAGNELPFAPKHSLSLVANYYAQTDFGEFNLQTSYSYSSKQWASVLASDADHLFADASGTWDARLSFAGNDGGWEIAVLAQNILDKRNWVSSTDVLGGLFGTPIPIGIPNYGASYRIELSYSF